MLRVTTKTMKSLNYLLDGGAAVVHSKQSYKNCLCSVYVLMKISSQTTSNPLLRRHFFSKLNEGELQFFVIDSDIKKN